MSADGKYAFREDLHLLPHYVYRLFDANDQLLYVGCTSSPAERKHAHLNTSVWFSEVARSQMTVFPNRAKALAKESQAIATEHPKYNLRGRWKNRECWEAVHYANFYAALAASSTRRDFMKRVAAEANRLHGLDLIGAEA